MSGYLITVKFKHVLNNSFITNLPCTKKGCSIQDLFIVSLLCRKDLVFNYPGLMTEITNLLSQRKVEDHHNSKTCQQAHGGHVLMFLHL